MTNTAENADARDAGHVRRYVVTGGASGIGQATVEAMLDRGYAVSAFDLNPQSIQRLVAANAAAADRGALVAHCVDVSDEAGMERAIRASAESFGGLDGIVNNAGIGGAFGPVTDLAVEDWDATFAVITRGTFIGIKHTTRVLIEQGTGGSIVNVGSITGIMGDGGPQAYSVAKAAVLHMARVFGAELAPHRIAVNTVNPGVIETPLNPVSERSAARSAASFRAQQPWPEVGQPQNVAEAILFLTSPRTTFLTGESITVDGGLSSVGARLGTELGTNSLGFGKHGMNFGTTGLAAIVRERG